MPEGDTIYRSATQLRKVMVDQTITAAKCHNPRFVSPLPEDSLVARQCTAVEPRGKHLLMHLSDGAAIHSHMGMTGSWHLYRRGATWRKPRNYASLAMEVAAWEVVCFTPPTLELLTADQLRRHEHLNRLGPDLLDPQFRVASALPRFHAHDQVAIGEAVMNQRIVCGIGNVYKSELLFLERFNPFAPVSTFADEQLARLLQRARKLMARNLHGERRTTRFRGGGRLWVYGRVGKPCLQCGTTVRMQRQGDAGRSTYWCPECQPTQRQ